MVRQTKPPSEFSRPVPVERLAEEGGVYEIEANPEERAALARRFDLVSLERLGARVTVSRSRRGLVRVEGRYEAELVQACVVSLEPVPARLAETFSVAFASAPAGKAGEVTVRVEAEDPPETVVGGMIDLAETVAQQLAVGLDPYPRAAGAKLPKAGWRVGPKDAAARPFAVLKGLAPRR